MYILTTEEEYECCVERGFDPLSPKKHDFSDDIAIGIELRITLQKKIFGKTILGRGNISAANERFYRWMWEYSPHRCEECLLPLRNYWSGYISHIISRGAAPDMAHDPRNVNILCHRHHSLWETGNRKTMRIYQGNLKIIEKLMSEYNSL